MIQSRWIESAIVPYVLASQMIPLIALVPILRAILRDAGRRAPVHLLRT